MKTVVVIALTLVASLTFAADKRDASADSVIPTVRELLGFCQEAENTTARTYCYGFLAGAHDLARIAAQSGELAIVCPSLPNNTKMEPLRVKLVAAAAANADLMEESGAVFVLGAMGCRPRK